MFISDYKKHPNKKIIDQDYEAAAPHDAYSLEVRRGIGMTKKATALVGEAIGAKKSHFDDQDQEARFILVGSRLGDDGVDSKSLVVDDISRKQIVEILNSEPDLNPAEDKAFEKSLEEEIIADLFSDEPKKNQPETDDVKKKI